MNYINGALCGMFSITAIFSAMVAYRTSYDREWKFYFMYALLALINSAFAGIQLIKILQETLQLIVAFS